MATLIGIAILCYAGHLIYGYRPATRKVGVGYGARMNEDALAVITAVIVLSAAGAGIASC